MYASLRTWRLLDLAAPSLKLKLPLDPLDLPFSVLVENKNFGRRDLFKMHGDLYQGTEYELSKGALAGPFGYPFPVEGGVASNGVGQIPRGISISRTVYSIVNELPVGKAENAVAWYAADTPATSVYVPYMALATMQAKPFITGTNREFTRDSAWWAFDFVQNLMRINYQAMWKDDVAPKQDEMQVRVCSMCAGPVWDHTPHRTHPTSNTRLCSMWSAFDVESSVGMVLFCYRVLLQAPPIPFPAFRRASSTRSFPPRYR